jgi:hypothetical protein
LGYGDPVDSIPLNDQGKVLLEVKSSITASPTGAQKVAYHAAELGQLSGAGGNADLADLAGKIKPISVMVLIPKGVEG